mmetsp:Transcript_98504/g.211143  ORF Transcript_98504/g.211143 Transcript_98504/m.211143 type:complete len:81 (+) Transcript_98504:1-243(+)
MRTDDGTYKMLKISNPTVYKEAATLFQTALWRWSLLQLQFPMLQVENPRLPRHGRMSVERLVGHCGGMRCMRRSMDGVHG